MSVAVLSAPTAVSLPVELKMTTSTLTSTATASTTASKAATSTESDIVAAYQLAAISARAQRPGKTGLFGYPISLSLAPTFHNACYKARSIPWTCSLLESQNFNDFLSFIKDPDFTGSAVTMPYKGTILDHVNEIDDEAKLIGAANTVYFRDYPDGTRSLVATNTDVDGIEGALSSAVTSPASLTNRRGDLAAVIVGGGGTTRTSIYTLRFRLHVSRIYIINRLDSEVEAIVADFKSKGVEGIEQLKTPQDVQRLMKGSPPDFIINAIPSYAPQSDGERVARATLEAVLSLASVPASKSTQQQPLFLEMCYHPHPWTIISTYAQSKGWKIIQGMEAMIHQAIAQQVLWLPPCDKEQMDALHTAGRKAVFDALRARGAFDTPAEH